MTVGASIFLIAVGAILRYAVTTTVAGIDIQTVGLILMIAGTRPPSGFSSSPPRETVTRWTTAAIPPCGTAYFSAAGQMIR